MGYAAHGQCFSSQLAAASASCAAYPLSWSVGTDTYTTSCGGVSPAGDSLSLTQTSTAASAPVAQTLALSFPTCDPLEPYTDVTELWLLGLAVIAPIAVMAAIYRRLLMNQ